MRTNERRPWPARLAFLAGSATISALLWSTVIGAPAPSTGAAAMPAAALEQAPLEVPLRTAAALATDVPVDPAPGAALASADPSSAFVGLLQGFVAAPERHEDHERGEDVDEDDEHEGQALPLAAPAPRPAAPAAPRPAAPAPAVTRPAPVAPRPAPAAPALRTRAS